MSEPTFKAGTSLRIAGKVYRPGNPIPPKALQALDTAEFERLFDAGKILPGKDQGEPAPPEDPEPETKEAPDAASEEEAEPEEGAGDEPAYTKEQLLAENKAFTEGLLESAGVDESAWGSLNKEPLIDFYLDRQNG